MKLRDSSSFKVIQTMCGNCENTQVQSSSNLNSSMRASSLEYITRAKRDHKYALPFRKNTNDSI